MVVIHREVRGWIHAVTLKGLVHVKTRIHVIVVRLWFKLLSIWTAMILLMMMIVKIVIIIMLMIMITISIVLKLMLVLMFRLVLLLMMTRVLLSLMLILVIRTITIGADIHAHSILRFRNLSIDIKGATGNHWCG